MLNNMNEEKQKWEEVYQKEDLPWLKNPIPTNLLEKFADHFTQGDKILDYGGGDGLLSRILIEKGFDVLCSDISEKALVIAKEKIPTLKTVQASDPFVFLEKGLIFDGVLVWGVMHHVQKEKWLDYLKSFHSIIKNGGIVLVGGHSTKDVDFQEGYRISPTTGYVSYAVNDLGEMAKEVGFEVIESDFFPFEEAFTGHERVFNYFFLKKN